MEYWEALVLAVIEGLTEFLPVSSTGHMIITSSFLGIAKHEFTKLFIIAIHVIWLNVNDAVKRIIQPCHCKHSKILS